jgi:signal transduction histidine kinase
MSTPVFSSGLVATILLVVASVTLIGYAVGRYRFIGGMPLDPRELLEALPDGLVVVDRRGVVRAVNTPAPVLLAAEGRDWVGSALLDVVVATPLEIDLRALFAVPTAQATASLIYEHDGGMRAVELRLRPLRMAGALLVVRDRTDRAQIEQTLDRRIGELAAEAAVRASLYERLREVSRAKSAFLATVTHELRTPLTSIIGFTDLLDRGLFGELPETAYEPLAQVRRNSQTMLRLINDILDFSKMEAGHLTVDLAPVDVSSLVVAVVSAMQPQIHERGIGLNVEVSPDLPPAMADAARLEQVLTNLLSNAIKFTDQGMITVRAWQDGDRVRFSVADTGLGIALEQHRLLFQEFQRIENDAGRRYPGTGLGLAISQRLMWLMGGALSVESALGVGSTFSGDLASASENLGEREQGAEVGV